MWALAVGAGLASGSAGAPGVPEQSVVASTGGVPTFSHDVAPLVRAKCGPCHHPRGAGPFSLLDYDDVVIHLFYEPAREFYRLERNWIDAHEVKLPEPIRKQAEGLRIRALG